MNTKRIQGFTLIELMIVVAILGIITAIAIPSYADYIRKGKRTDAKVELLKIAQLQESYFVQNLSYAKDLTIGTGGLGLGTDIKSEQGEYTISVTATPGGCTGVTGANACTGYTILAEGNGSQENDRCGDFTITNNGVKNTTGTGETTARCWK